MDIDGFNMSVQSLNPNPCFLIGLKTPSNLAFRRHHRMLMLQRLLQDVGTRLPEPGVQWADALSQREQEVARFAAMGDSNAEIADRLSISERTVRAHLSAIFEKLQVSDRLMLALKVHGIGKKTPA